MAIANVDIRCAAHLLVTRHGADAPIHAAMRADEPRAAGDAESVAIWTRIRAAVAELLRAPAPDGDDTIH